MDYFIGSKEESESQEGLVDDISAYENPHRILVLWGFFLIKIYYFKILFFNAVGLSGDSVGEVEFKAYYQDSKNILHIHYD